MTYQNKLERYQSTMRASKFLRTERVFEFTHKIRSRFGLSDRPRISVSRFNMRTFIRESFRITSPKPHIISVSLLGDGAYLHITAGDNLAVLFPPWRGGRGCVGRGVLRRRRGNCESVHACGRTRRKISEKRLTRFPHKRDPNFKYVVTNMTTDIGYSELTRQDFPPFKSEGYGFTL